MSDKVNRRLASAIDVIDATLTEDDKHKKALCDLTVERAVGLMLEQGAGLDMIIDRMTTYAVAQAVSAYGVAETLKVFDAAAAAVRNGVFDHLAPRKLN